MSRNRIGPDPQKLARYVDCATRGLTCAQTAEYLGIRRDTVKAYAKDNGIAFCDYNPCRTKEAPPRAANVPRDVLTVIKKSRNELGHIAKPMPISLPKPPFELDLEVER